MNEIYQPDDRIITKIFYDASDALGEKIDELSIQPVFFCRFNTRVCGEMFDNQTYEISKKFSCI